MSVIADFYKKLQDTYGDEYLDKRKIDLLGEEASHESWLEYCFSFESPF